MRITPQLLLKAYASGVFPMAKSREERAIYWVQPEERGVLPLTDLHIPRSLKKTIRQHRFEITADLAFHQVIKGCAEPGPGRENTWINHEIEELFHGLHAAGMAHSVETWAEGKLVGGLYGLAMGGAFFGESMFSRTTDASKVALCALAGILIRGDFVLLDTQFLTEHLARFGTVEVDKQVYSELLDAALSRRGRWGAPPQGAALLDLLARGPAEPLPIPVTLPRATRED